MHRLGKLMKELRELKVRVDALRALGEEALASERAAVSASNEYGALKSHLERRLKEVARLSSAGARPFRAFLLLGALRHGYLAMKASKRTSPRNNNWQRAVRSLQSEVDGHVSLLRFKAVDETQFFNDGKRP